MTTDRKFCFIRSVRSRFALLSLSLRVGTLLLLAACTTTKSQTGSSRNNEQKEEIRNQVQAAKIIECRLNSSDWTIPGDVGQAQMIKADGRWALIYEALLRTGPRSVYQPLQTNFAFNGDGIAMGLREAPRVSDVKTFEDTNRNRWFVSRIKTAGSELYSGLVEVLVNGKNYRSILQMPPGESVQQIWPSLPAVSGFANIVVRSTPADDSGVGQDDDSVFRWYQVNAAENSAKLISSFKPRNESIQVAGFVSLEKTTEPVAITITQPKLESADAEPTTVNSISKISLRRIFGKNLSVSERVIFSGKGSFSGLNVSDSTFNPSIHLAWIFAPLRGGSRYLQTATLPIRFIPDRYFSRAPFRDLENLLATEISYEANSPDFSLTVNNQNQPVPVLSWWGKLEQDVALLVQVVTPAFRQLRGNALKTPDGLNLGVQFYPSLAVIPPRQFNRVLFFTAAPTQSEKSIMVLSNRSDSAEIAKESNLQSCFF